jgi:4-hydroxybenzoate polyprenyltransferase
MLGCWQMIMIIGIITYVCWWIDGLIHGEPGWWILLGGVIAAVLFRPLISALDKKLGNKYEDKDLFQTILFWGPYVIIITSVVILLIITIPNLFS